MHAGHSTIVRGRGVREGVLLGWHKSWFLRLREFFRLKKGGGGADGRRGSDQVPLWAEAQVAHGTPCSDNC